MPGLPVRLRTADRTALVALCLLLVASVSARIYAYRTASPASGPSPGTGVVALGEGVFVPRRAVGQRLVWTASCPAPVTVDFVEPSPHGRDTSLAAPPNPSDRTYYVYRGWTLDGPRAAMKLSILYFTQRAGAVLGMSGAVARDELAVKLVVPAACDASPDEVVAALRRDMRSAF